MDLLHAVCGLALLCAVQVVVASRSEDVLEGTNITTSQRNGRLCE